MDGLSRAIRHGGGDYEHPAGAEACPGQAMLFRESEIFAVRVARRRQADQPRSSQRRFGNRIIGESVVLPVGQIGEVAVHLGIDATEQCFLRGLQAGECRRRQMLPLGGVRQPAKVPRLTLRFPVRNQRGAERGAEASSR
jgi:hypothetical protein